MTKTPWIDNGMSDDEKIERISNSFKDILETLGMDLSDDSLRDTPKRVAKMYVLETFKGLKPANFPKMTCIDNSMNIDEMVCVKGIKVMSACEHHLVPIHGFATVAYVAKDKVIGLSKINRIVDYFSRRPQVQERLTKQIADQLCEVLGTDDVAVFIDAKHYCVISRGVEDQGSTTATSDLRGIFKADPKARSEFLQMCR